MSDHLSYRMRDSFFQPYEEGTCTPDFGFPMGAGNTLGEHSWITKYSRRKDDGSREHFWEGLRRVIEGMYSIQKDHAARYRLPWNEKQAHASAEEAYTRAFAGKWSPPGRGLWMMGTELVNGKGDSSALQNCFTGDTRFLTFDNGICTLAERAGEDVTVWTGPSLNEGESGGWEDGRVRYFGRQPVQRITFAPHSIRSNIRIVETATPDHRWELQDGSLTTSLKVGDAVPAAAPSPHVNDEEGFRHGLIFGDGSINYRYVNGDYSFMLRLCGEKGKHAPLFTKTIAQPSFGGDLVAYHRSAVDMKSVPVAGEHASGGWGDPVTSYLHSFILGWAAADGKRREDDSREQKSFKLSTQDQEAADWLLSHAVAAGFILLGHNILNNVTNYGPRTAPLHTFTLIDARNQRYWTVKSIEPLDEEEDVYCVVVPEIERFTLASGVYTSNCAFLSTLNIADLEDPSRPFTRMMDMSMLGVGVGFDTLGAGKITLNNPLKAGSARFVPHQVADSREGWCEATANLLRAFFMPGRRFPLFDYAKIRPAGAPIKTFGGVAAGPGPLVKLHAHLVGLLRDRQDEPLTSTDITDIMNMVGKCVVSANVRRSAQIALGQPDDKDFLDLKDWGKQPVRMGRDGWGHLSNNSVYAHVGLDYSFLVPRIASNGEPGLYWNGVAARHGRLCDPPDDKEYRTVGINPCGEQPLEDNELCTLVETFPSRHSDLQDYLRTLKFAYLYGKTVTLLMTRWPETNEVMIRNRRIGTSMTGVAQFAEERGWSELRRWQDKGYREVRRWDKIYSEWLGVRESIRVTTVKPSGTVSLLWGVTPGVHFPREAGFYVRTVREMTGSPFAAVMQAAGYPVEPSVSDPDTTVVITLPVEGPQMRSEQQVSIWEKAALAAHCQEWWSDNAVSCTVTFTADEVTEIPAVLRAFDGKFKSISFLPLAEGTYEQAPYQRVSPWYWQDLRANVKPIDWEALYSDGKLPEAEGEMYCSNDVCEVPAPTGLDRVQAAVNASRGGPAPTQIQGYA